MYDSLQFNLEHTSNASIIQRELELEDEALEMTIRKIREQTKAKGIDAMVTGKALSNEWLPLLTNGINNWVDEVSVKRNRPPLAYKYISLVKAEVLAYVTARSVLQTLVSPVTTFTGLADVIGRRVRDIVEFELLSETDSDIAKSIKHRLKYTNQSTREPLLRRALEAAKFEGLGWEKEDLVSIGAKLIELCETLTGFISTELEVSGGTTTRTVSITKLATDWLAESEHKEALMAAWHYPMLVPPLPWSTPYNGGYLNKQLQPLNLVLAKKRVVNRRLENVHMPKVYDAVNAVQATPWRVNKKVLEVLTHYSKLPTSLSGLPTSTLLDLPEKPWDETLDELELGLWMQFNQEEFKKWKVAAGKVHQANAVTKSKYYALTQKLILGEKFKDEVALYYPTCLDYRGRIYSMASSGTMNPQSDDSGKALLQFAVAKPLGTHGGYWLAIEVANTYGQDKLPLDERVQWTVANTDMILSVANDPYGNTSWLSEADKPWCFLAACYEWQGFMSHGDAWESRCNVSLDGSTSGLQHFGAMLKDQQTLVNTNVLQVSERPSDMYTLVSESAQEAVDAATDPIATQWRTRIQRQTVKPSAMTKAYGVSVRGMVAQIADESNGLISKGRIEPFDCETFEAAQYLAPIVDNAITSRCGAATEAMDWLKSVSKVCSEAGCLMSWTTQNGLEVTMEYKQVKQKRLTVLYCGQEMRVTLNKPTHTIDKRKSAQSAAPCYVHSLDADHLISTVNMCHENGIDTFGMIHDSFSCHAADTDTLWQSLRFTFWEQYSGNVLQELYTEIRDQLPEPFKDKLPYPPAQGTAELENVMYSDFFFA